MSEPAHAFHFGPPHRPRRLVSLTPLIDVILLLLVFFMLASRFSVESAMPADADAGAHSASGPPRLIDVTPDVLRLNGQTIAFEALGPAMRRLALTSDAVVAVRLSPDVDVQRLVDVVDALTAERLTNVVLIER